MEAYLNPTLASFRALDLIYVKRVKSSDSIMENPQVCFAYSNIYTVRNSKNCFANMGQTLEG